MPQTSRSITLFVVIIALIICGSLAGGRLRQLQQQLKQQQFIRLSPVVHRETFTEEETPPPTNASNNAESISSSSATPTSAMETGSIAPLTPPTPPTPAGLIPTQPTTTPPTAVFNNHNNIHTNTYDHSGRRHDYNNHHYDDYDDRRRYRYTHTYYYPSPSSLYPPIIPSTVYDDIAWYARYLWPPATPSPEKQGGPVADHGSDPSHNNNSNSLLVASVVMSGISLACVAYWCGLQMRKRK
jgi:hypothetical protein